MHTFFGTDGIRGTVATNPYLSAPFLHRLGKSLAQWAQFNHGTMPAFVIGTDTRASAHTIFNALAYGIMKGGGICFNAGITPTPALQHLVTKQSHYYHYGIMITASHNDAADNGIKIITPQGKLLISDQEVITDLVAHTPSFSQCPATLTIPPIQAHHASSYLTHFATIFPANMLAGMHIVLDCAQGATYRMAPMIFQSCGARVTVIGNEPDGMNINGQWGSTAPQNLRAMVIQTNADMGFAFDGDGDRVLAVNHQGEIFNGDDILALLTTHPRFAGQSTIVGTIMTNSGLTSWLHAHRKKLVRSAVGDAHVERVMRAHRAELGGEPSGHIIIRSHLPTADGIYAALYAAHTALITNNRRLKTFAHLAQATVNLPTKQHQSLTEEPFVSIIRAHEQTLLPGRSVVRYSGTEPVLRIMTEHPDQEVALQSSLTLAHQLEPYIHDLGA
ncbi:MAG: phosphoglucosamine mutase [Candidatus Dependentiae bacterium]|nr:phosphoglucosamine mutase [Candidatus Dependentiae bacterium]